MNRKLLSAIYVLLVFCLIAVGCNDFGSAPITERTTFIKLFERGGDLKGQVCEVLTDGYVLGSNFNSGLINESILNKLDSKGNVIWEHTIKKSSVNSIREVEDGYLILGNSIQTNDTALNVNDRVITKFMLTKVDKNGVKIDSVIYSDPKNPTVDYQSTGIALDRNGNIIMAGNKKGSQPTDLSKSFLVACNPSLDTLWTRTYTLQDQDFTNAKNVFVTSGGEVLWANSVQKANLSQTLSYLTNSLVVPQLTFSNYSYFGQLLIKNRFVGSEMSLGFSTYGLVGTFSDSQGKSANMFFIQADASGNFLPATLLVFDGEQGDVTPTNLDDTPNSESDDAGSAVSLTADGGFLIGGSLNTTLKRGNGKLDIWLIKIDNSGKVVWNKNYGGSGDDVVSSIRLLNDGGFLVCGSSSVNGLSSAYIMRIDANGEILK
jgi:hypothetical protein